METMINLSDLLKHEIQDLYSVEEQIIEAMPAMIEKAKNPELTRALREHLKITEEQKKRLDKIKSSLSNGENTDESGEKKGFFSRLFGGGSGGEKCKGMEGIISEGEKMMGADIAEETMDAVVIACAQKIEHYEICGYGTARAYARELKMPEVERLLTETLNEEYTADDMLTRLAVGRSNIEAENATGMEEERGRKGRGANSKGGSSKGGSSKGSSSKGGSKGGSSSKGSSKSGSSKGGNSKTGSKGGSSKGGNSSKPGSSKSGGSKGGSSKGGSASKGGNSKGGSSKGGSKGGSSKAGSKAGNSKGGSKSGSSKGSSKGGNSKGGSRKR